MKLHPLYKNTFFVFFLVFVMFIFSGCSGDSSSPKSSKSEKGAWDNTPKVLTPTSDGSAVYSCDFATIDASGSSNGYLIVSYTGANQKPKLQITGPDQVTYTYDLHGADEVFPLTGGNGAYTAAVMENIADAQYSVLLSQDFNVSISDELLPYLYPSQYVPFTADSKAVAKGSELAFSADTALDVVELVYCYVINHVSYDYDKASSVSPGYLPIIDDTLQDGTGICLDYAALIASMLRTQGIPTRLEVGYCGEEYHAWISVYTKEDGWICGIIECKNGVWTLLDPTFASSTQELEKFVPDNDEYLLKYQY